MIEILTLVLQGYEVLAIHILIYLFSKTKIN